MMRNGLAVSAWLVVLMCSASARADQALRLEPAERGQVHIDGALGEWRGLRFATLGSGADASVRYALAYDGEALLLAAEVTDERMVRTARPGPKEDALVLTLALPGRSGRLRGVEVWVFAGIPGRRASQLGVAKPGGRPRRVSGAQVVEGPRSGGSGYVVEARIPWSALPVHSARWRRGRGAIRLHDVDEAAHPEVESVLASAEAAPSKLEALPALNVRGGVTDTLKTFLETIGHPASQPRFDMDGDVAGDGRPERIVIVEQHVAVMGPGYREGKGYDYKKLPVAMGTDVREARLRDLTGDGKRELVLELRQRQGSETQQLWLVMRFAGEGMRPVFAIPLERKLADGRVQARLRVERARSGPPAIEVRAGEAEGLQRGALPRQASDAIQQPMPLPWSKVIARRYRWDGKRFALAGEKENPDYEPPQAERPAPSRARPAAAASSGSASARTAGMKALIGEYRRARGVSQGVPARFRQRANVAQGPEPEQVLVIDRALVVVGPRFRQGSSYFFFQLPTERAQDVLAMKAVDVTKDGRAEIFVQIARPQGEIEREMLLGYQFRDGGFQRVLGAEVARRQDGHAIENSIRFVRRPPGPWHLELRPGRARHWDARSYPYRNEQVGEMRPPLLPWRDETVRFRFDGQRLVPR